MKSVYVETTVIGSIAGRLYPNKPVLYSRQLTTREWWTTAPSRYRLYASEMVISECADGDPTAAAERLEVTRTLPIIKLTLDAEKLAALMVERKAVPHSKIRDATHIALAAGSSIDYLATWNFKHFLNPHTLPLIDHVCREYGYEPPIICTPEQLMENIS